MTCRARREKHYERSWLASLKAAVDVTQHPVLRRRIGLLMARLGLKPADVSNILKVNQKPPCCPTPHSHGGGCNSDPIPCFITYAPLPPPQLPRSNQDTTALMGELEALLAAGLCASDAALPGSPTPPQSPGLDASRAAAAAAAGLSASASPTASNRHQPSASASPTASSPTQSSSPAASPLGTPTKINAAVHEISSMEEVEPYVYAEGAEISPGVIFGGVAGATRSSLKRTHRAAHMVLSEGREIRRFWARLCVEGEGGA